MIKKILIGAGIIVITAGIAFVSLYFIKQVQPYSPDESTPKVVLDFSKDYGACSILDIAGIKTALGDVAADLQPPENMGIVSSQLIGEDVENISSDAQICIYSFSPGGTLENGFNSGNALMIQVIKYEDESESQALIEQIKSDELNIAVDGVGDSAFYNASTTSQGPGATYSFKLYVFTAKTLTEYTISQPAESASFTIDSGKAALLQLGKLAKQL